MYGNESPVVYRNSQCKVYKERQQQEVERKSKKQQM